LAYHQPFQIIGFHSCDRELGLRLLNGSEICVLNTALIKGYFLPRPVEEFNPYLNREFNR